MQTAADIKPFRLREISGKEEFPINLRILLVDFP